MIRFLVDTGHSELVSNIAERSTCWWPLALSQALVRTPKLIPQIPRIHGKIGPTTSIKKPKFYVATRKLINATSKLNKKQSATEALSKKAVVSPQVTMQAIRRNGIYQRRRRGSSLSLSSRSSSSPLLGLEFFIWVVFLLGIGWGTSWSETWNYRINFRKDIPCTSFIFKYHQVSHIGKRLEGSDSFPNFSSTDPWFQHPEAWWPVPPQQKPWARQSLQQKTEWFSSVGLGFGLFGCSVAQLLGLFRCMTKTTKTQWTDGYSELSGSNMIWSGGSGWSPWELGNSKMKI